MRWIAIVLAVCAASARAEEFPEDPDAPSAFTTRIDAREYDDRFSSVEDVLREVPGVRVRRFGGLGSFSTASIRASKPEQVLILLDGVPLNSAGRGAVDLSSIPLRQVESIDVIRGGAATARYGADAVGGVITIRTRRPDEDLATDMSFTTGRWKTVGGDGSLSFDRGAWRGLVSYERLRSENDYKFDHGCTYNGGICDIFGPFLPTTRNTRINADFLRQSGLANGTLVTGPTSELFSTFQLASKQRGQPGVTSTTITPQPDDVVSAANPSEDYLRGIASVGWRDTEMGRGALESRLYYRYDRNEFDDPLGEIINPSARFGRTRFSWTEQAGGGEVAYALSPFALGPLRISGRSNLRVRREGLSGDEVDDPSRWIAGAYLQSELSLFESRLRIVPALGLDRAWSNETTVLSPGTGAPIRVRPDEDLEPIPQVGAIVQLAPAVRLKANAGRSFRRPTFSELFMPNLGFIRGNWRLQPEDALNYDAGVEIRRQRIGPIRGLSLEAAWFYRDIDDAIEFVQVNTATREPRNIGQAIAQGWEFAGSFDLFDRLEITGSYTYTDTKLVNPVAFGLPRGRPPIPFTPENSWFARAGLDVGVGRAWVQGSFEDEMFLDELATYSLDPAYQVDVGFTVFLARLPGLRKLPADLSVTTEWVNVTDVQRFESIGLPLPGQYWYLRVRGRFSLKRGDG